MSIFRWPRRAASPLPAQTELLTRKVHEPNKASIEANIAEIRAKRGQIILNSILDDVISAGIAPARCGGHADGE